MADLSAIFFPHSFVREADIAKTRPLFEKISICKPWFMEMSPPTAEGEDLHSAQILYPPEELKPKEDFKPLFSEYLQWVRQNQDKGYIDFLKADRKTVLSEDTRWEIGQMIREIGEDSTSREEMNTFKWHLFLHLAGEHEKNWLEAGEMLREIKRSKPPLIDAIEQGPEIGEMLKDLPQSDTYPSVDETYLNRVFDAWLGLFGSYLPGHGPLVTFDRQVINYAADTFGEDADASDSEAESDLSSRLVLSNVRFRVRHLPIISVDDRPENERIIKGLSGKTIIFIEE